MLQSLLFWTTPWDPAYEIGVETMIVYYRIDPNGVAYIDRFVPYYDSSQILRVSWEEEFRRAPLRWVR